MKYSRPLMIAFFIGFCITAISPVDGAENPFDFVEEFSIAEHGLNYSVPVYRGKIEPRLLLSGWALAEIFTSPEPRIWAIGRKAEFKFSSELLEPKEILFHCQPLNDPKAPTQELEIFVNDKKIAEETILSGNKGYKVSVPADAVRIGWNKVRFDFSRVSSPKDINPLSPDTRPLAANFVALMVLPESYRGKVPARDTVREETSGGEKVLFQEYPSRVSYSSRIPQDPKLELQCMIPRTVSRNKVDFVTMKLLLETEDGEEEIFEKRFQPVPAGEKPEWISISKELGQAGKIARFSFICDASPAEKTTRAAVLWKGTLTGKPPMKPEAPEKPFKTPESIILISIDTLRADTLGCYGYDKNTSSNIDQFATDSTLFERCYSHAPSTLPSHGTIFTSLYPTVHNGHYTAKTSVRKDVPTLAEMLLEKGYQTVAFTGGGQLDRVFGVARGFQLYEQVEEDFKITCEDASKWIEANGKEPFFLFLHTYAVHAPYTPPPHYARMFVSEDYDGPLSNMVDLPEIEELEREGKLTPADVAHTKALYDAETKYMDDVFGNLIARIKELGLYDDALIMFTSDHGEEFGEHGVVATHSHTVYDELLDVPMIVKWPGNALSGKRIKSMVSLGDILPTLIDAAGIPPYPAAIGSSLIPIAMDCEHEQKCYSQMEGSLRECIFEEDLKLILNHNAMESSSDKKQAPHFELFNLGSDPKEQNNIVEQHPVVADYLSMEIRRIRSDIERKSKSGDSSEKVIISEDLQKQLKGLGYAN